MVYLAASYSPCCDGPTVFRNLDGLTTRIVGTTIPLAFLKREVATPTFLSPIESSQYHPATFQPLPPTQIRNPDRRVGLLLHGLGTDNRRVGLPHDFRCPPAALVLNQVDLVPFTRRPLLLQLADDLRALHQFVDVFYTSAVEGTQVEELREWLLT